MNRKCFGMLVAAIVGLGLALDAAWGMRAPRRHEQTLLLVPALPRTIQLAFDMAHLRPEALVAAWHGDAKTREPVLHVWSGTDWRYVSLADFNDKLFTPAQVGRAIVIGESASVPPALLANMPWCGQVERLETLNTADLVNDLDKTFRFRESEWTWLAQRYGLDLADLNAEKRRRNPYDIPRSKLPVEKREYKREPGEPPPAELIEGGSEEAAPAPAPVMPPAKASAAVPASAVEKPPK